jgi:hypothetical protein
MPATTEERLASIEKRRVLAEWVGQRTTATGTLLKVNHNNHPTKRFLVALLENVEVELGNRERHELGHFWIQYAEPFRQVLLGARIACTCTVSRYTAKLGEGTDLREEITFGLRYPNNVRLLDTPISYRTTEEPTMPNDLIASPAPSCACQSKGNEDDEAPPPAPMDPIDLILRTRDLITKAGGLEGVLALRHAIAKSGGMAVVLELEDLAASVGGWDRLETLLGLLKT